MIGRLQGKVLEKRAPDLLLDVGGVGYELQMPMTSFYQLNDNAENVVIHTHFVVREDAQLLYGFAEKVDRDLFRLLLKANGVGPKLGLAILSGMTASQFVRCVEHDDVSTLVKLPGVGKKTAERLLIEMRDRLKSWQQSLDTPFTDIAPVDDSVESTLVTQDNPVDDAVSALESLGYSSAQASKAIKAVAKPGMSSEELIKLSLRAML